MPNIPKLADQPPAPYTTPPAEYPQRVLPFETAAPMPAQNAPTARLRLQATTASLALPLADCQVTISYLYQGQRYLIHFTRTDLNGNTPLMALSAPPAAGSLSPEAGNPFTAYEARVSRQDFYTRSNLPLFSFADRLAIQPIQLTPLALPDPVPAPGTPPPQPPLPYNPSSGAASAAAISGAVGVFAAGRATPGPDPYQVTLPAEAADALPQPDREV